MRLAIGDRHRSTTNRDMDACFNVSIEVSNTPLKNGVTMDQRSTSLIDPK